MKALQRMQHAWADQEEAGFNEAFEAQRTLAGQADRQAAGFGLEDCVNFTAGEVG